MNPPLTSPETRKHKPATLNQTPALPAPLREAPLSINEISGIIVETAIRIHRQLGPGLLESVYQAILSYELQKQGLSVECEVPISVHWDDLCFEIGFRADLIVEGQVMVELKSIEATAPVHKKKLLTYLRLADMRVGLLINFGMVLLKNGISRVVNGLVE